MSSSAPLVFSLHLMHVNEHTQLMQVFENELRVYEEEGIEVKVSPAVYNTSCLRMLTGKRDGVLPMYV